MDVFSSDRFTNRSTAGKKLGEALSGFQNEEAIVLGMARGGVPVAAEVARTLSCPLEVLVIRKLGVPFHPELAMGAIAPLGVRVLDDSIVKRLKIKDHQIADVEQRERDELERRLEKYRQGRSNLEIAGKVALIVDDGLATGNSAKAAVHYVKKQSPATVVLAVPVAAQDSLADLKSEVDDVVTLLEPEYFGAVGAWYQQFDQTSDEEVIDILEHFSPVSSG